MNRVTKKFTSGFLKGLEVTELTSVNFEINKKYKEWTGKATYKIVKIEKV